jgi:hypothetical protein
MNFIKFAIILIFAFSISSCEKNELEVEDTIPEEVLLKSVVTPNPIIGVEYFTQPLEFEACGEIAESNYINSENLEIGTIKVSNDEEKLYIEFQTNGDWSFLMANIYIGDYSNIPLNSSNNVDYRSFPIQTRFDEFISYVVYSIPLDAIQDDFTIVPMIYAFNFDNGTLLSREYIYGGDDFIGNSTFEKYLDYSIQDCITCEYVPVSYDLIAKRNVDVGDLVITNDEEFLYVTYSLEDDWYVRSARMFIGDVNDMPINRGGNPIIGHFPIKEHFNCETSSFTYTFELSELPECYVIAVHSSVKKIVNGQRVFTSGCWSYGTKFNPRKRWGWYSEYCTQYCN